jgi:hypothetical protein
MICNLASSCDEVSVRRALSAAGYGLFTLEGNDVQDFRSFYLALRREVPMGDARFDPEIPNWDGIIDYLRQGLLPASGLRKVAVIWRRADRSLSNAPRVVVSAIECLVGFGDEALAAPSGRLILTVVLLGDDWDTRWSDWERL